MKSLAVCFAVAFSAALFLDVRAASDGGSSPCGCDVVRRAFDDYRRITPGIKRKVVEQYFKYDGGLHFPNRGVYVYPECDYIKLVVEYAPAPSRGRGMTSADDAVRGVSKLYIEYPTRD